MNTAIFLEILTVAEKLKCNTRHSWTSSGRHESVAEHTWRIALMALLMRDEFPELLKEMNERKTDESKIYKALDNLEAVIQHNEADISTWIPLEYDLQFTYGADKVEFSPYLKELKKEIDQRTTEKIAQKNEA